MYIGLPVEKWGASGGGGRLNRVDWTFDMKKTPTSRFPSVRQMIVESALDELNEDWEGRSSEERENARGRRGRKSSESPFWRERSKAIGGDFTDEASPTKGGFSRGHNPAAFGENRKARERYLQTVLPGIFSRYIPEWIDRTNLRAVENDCLTMIDTLEKAKKGFVSTTRKTKDGEYLSWGNDSRDEDFWLHDNSPMGKNIKRKLYEAAIDVEELRYAIEKFRLKYGKGRFEPGEMNQYQKDSWTANLDDPFGSRRA